MAIIEMQKQVCPVIGVGSIPGGSLTIVMDSATPLCFAQSFVVPNNPFSSGSVYLDEFRWYCSAVSGSPKVTAYIVADVSGVPDVISSALDTGNEITLSGTGWIAQTFPAANLYALTTATTQYWVVLKCTSGTSATISYGYASASTSPIPTLYNLGSQLHLWKSRVDSGTGAAWAGTDRYAVQGTRFRFTNATDTAYFGFPFSQTYTSTMYKIDGTVLVGGYCTLPSNISLSVRSIGMTVRKYGAPGNLSLKVYEADGTTPITDGTSAAVPAANMGTGSHDTITFDFATAITLKGGVKYRFVMSAASGDATTNYYTTTGVVMDPDSISTGTVDLSPFSSGMCSLNSTTWTTLPENQIPIAIIQNTLAPFNAPTFPTAGNTIKDVTYGWASEYTGTFDEAARNTDPGEANVKDGTTYKIQNVSKEGSYAGGGGGRPEIRGNNL